MKRLAIHPLLLAAFPILQLATHSIDQIDPLQAVRPLLIVLAATALLWAVLAMVLGSQVAYIDRRIAEISAEMIRQSDPPPILIIQGDHGVAGHNGLQILNLYYFPQGGAEALYPTITPVNSFRILFDTYFGADLDLLPDYSFDQVDESTQVKEPQPACQVAP